MGGAGSWNLDSLSWNDSTGEGEALAWPGLADSAAIFAGVPGTVTVSAAGIALNELRFVADGYELAGVEGSNLFLFGVEPRIEVVEGLARVSSAAILGGDGVWVTGGGTLWLQRSIAVSGGVRVLEGTLRLGVTAAGDSDPRAFLGGSPLELSDGHLEIYASSSVNSNVSMGSLEVKGESSITAVRTAEGVPDNLFTSLAGTGGVRMDGKLIWNVGGNVLEASTATTSYYLTLGAVTMAGPTAFVTTGDGVRNTHMRIGALSEEGGAHSFTKLGNGWLRFGGINTNTGTTFVSEGVLYLLSGAALSPASAVMINPETGKAGQLNLSLNGPHSQTIGSLASAGEGTATVSLGGSSLRIGQDGTDSSFTGVISGAGGSVSKVGGGTLTLGAANTFSGGCFLQEGTLRVTTISALGSTASPPSPRVFLRAGTLRVDLPASVNSTTNRGFEIGPEGGVGSVTISVDSLNQLAILGVVTDAPGGSGRIIKRGPGTLRFQDVVNTFSGGVEILEGTLSVGVDSRLGAVPVVPTPGHIVIDGGRLLATSGFTLNSARGVAVGPQSGSGEGVISVVAGSTLTIGGLLSNQGGGRGKLIKEGGGTLRVINSANTFTGGLEIREGDVSVAIDSRLGAIPVQPTPGNLILNGGVLTATANFTLNLNRGIAVGPEEGDGIGGINVTAGTLSYAGVIEDHAEGMGALVKTGVGSLRLSSGANRFSGGLVLQAGRVIAERGAGSLGEGAVRFAADSVLTLVEWTEPSGVERTFSIDEGVTATIETVGGNPQLALLGEITGRGAMVKTGAGFLQLAHANGYEGGTVVREGTLEVAAGVGSATGLGPVVVEAGASFGGVGTVAGAVRVEGLGGLPAKLRPGGQAVMVGQAELVLAEGLEMGVLSEVELRVGPYGYGRLVVGEISRFEVGSQIRVELEPFFLPAPGSVYPLLAVGQMPVGVNLTEVVSLPSGVDWDVSELNATGVLKVMGEREALTVTAPPSLVVAPGEVVTLSVMATGSGPWFIRWFKDDELMEGRVGPDLQLGAVGLSDGGSYRAEVSNGVETVLSEPGTLLVTAVPVITSQPQGQTVPIGQEAVFTVNAVGPGTLSYDWRFNGQSLGVANSAALTVLADDLADAGAYSVRVFNGNGEVISDEAVLVVNQIPVIVEEPQRIAADEGERARFTVVATGTPELEYQWQLNGVDLLGETEASIEVVVGPGTYGSYRVVVSNSLGSVTSATALLSPLRAGDPEQVPEWAFAGALPAAQIGKAYRFRPRVRPDDPVAGLYRAADQFSARGLPAGLVMDAGTGEITGRPSVFRSAPYVIILRASNAFGAVELRTQMIVIGLPVAMVGSYAGPLERGGLLSAVGGDRNGALGGRVEFTVTALGQVSGRLTVGARVFPFRGRVTLREEDGKAEVRIEVIQKRVVLFEITGVLNPVTGAVETGTVSDAGAVSSYVAWKNPWNRSNRAESYAGYYTARLERKDGDLTSEVVPIGSGFWAFTVSPTTGRMNLVGRLADGTAVTVASFVGGGGEVGVFRALYGAAFRGSILGSLTLSAIGSETPGRVAGDLTWWRPENNSRTNRVYRSGFPSLLELEANGERYQVPGTVATGSSRVMGLTDVANGIEVSFTGADLEIAQPLGAVIGGTVDERNRVSFAPAPLDNPRRVVLSFVARTGLFGGRLVLNEPNPVLLPTQVKALVRTINYQGVLVGSEGVGYLLVPMLPALVGDTPVSTSIQGARVSVRPQP